MWEKGTFSHLAGVEVYILEQTLWTVKSQHLIEFTMLLPPPLGIHPRVLGLCNRKWLQGL